MAEPAEVLELFDLDAEVHELLGGRKVIKRGKRPIAEALLASIRDGLPAEALVRLVEHTALPLPTMLALLCLPERTWDRKKKGKKALSVPQSDRLYRIARAVARATDVLGSRTKAVDWLQEENRALGARPLDLLDTEIGEHRVNTILGRIEFGLFS